MNTVARTKTLLKCCVIRMFAFVAMAFTFSMPVIAADYYPSMSGPYYWNNRYTGNGSIKMRPSDTHICVLTEVGGNFRGAGESLAARVHTDGYWYLGGTAAQEIGLRQSVFHDHCLRDKITGCRVSLPPQRSSIVGGGGDPCAIDMQQRPIQPIFGWVML